jgi:hypothetical protein
MLEVVVALLTKARLVPFRVVEELAAVVAVLQLLGVLELLALPIQVGALAVEIILQELAAQAVAVL